MVICLSVITGGTLAFFTAEDTARNVITSGGIGVSIVEQQLVGGELQPYPGDPIAMMPAQSVSKIVSVQNLQNAAWVRAKYAVKVLAADGSVMDIPEEELKNVIVITPDEGMWTLRDGWWYYADALQSGETTAPLFDTVAFSGEDMDNRYQNCTVTVDVTAQAVQQVHNGGSVDEAAGWPAN